MAVSEIQIRLELKSGEKSRVSNYFNLDAMRGDECWVCFPDVTDEDTRQSVTFAIMAKKMGMWSECLLDHCRDRQRLDLDPLRGSTLYIGRLKWQGVVEREAFWEMLRVPFMVLTFSTTAPARAVAVVQCPVCLSSFTPNGQGLPKILPCGHTACLACLAGLPVHAFRIDCPMCREEALIAGGADLLPTNYSLVEQIETVQHLPPSRPRS